MLPSIYRQRWSVLAWPAVVFRMAVIRLSSTDSGVAEDVARLFASCDAPGIAVTSTRGRWQSREASCPGQMETDSAGCEAKSPLALWLVGHAGMLPRSANASRLILPWEVLSIWAPYYSRLHPKAPSNTRRRVAEISAPRNKRD